MNKIGTLFVVSGPSAVGKSTVVESVLRINPKLIRVITCTSRVPRKGEENGRDYIFLDKNDFLQRIQNNEFIEFSEVYGNYYGVLLSEIRKITDSGQNAVLVINWEGFQKIKQVISSPVIGIFINPPSLKALEERIKGRNTDSQEVINHRLSLARNDMKHADIYDKRVVNRDIEETAQQIVEYINEMIRHEIS